MVRFATYLNLNLTFCFADQGALYTWGTAVHGQHGSVARVLPTPTLMTSLSTVPIRQIACSRYHAVAVSGTCCLRSRVGSCVLVGVIRLCFCLR